MNARRTRGVLAAVVALGLVLAGCASGDGAGGAQPAGPTRTVTDYTGAPVTVPVRPQRVVTLHYAATAPTVDLGLLPVGQAEVTPNLVPEAVASTLAPVPVVTARFEPRIEQVALLEPDLILAPSYLKDDVLTQLRAIAPVYVFSLRARPGEQADFADKEAAFADLLGRRAELDQRAEAFRARREQIARTYAAQIRATTVAAVSAYRDNTFTAWGTNSSVGRLLTSLGFRYSAQADASPGSPEAELSFEKVGGAVGDANLLFLDSDLRGKPSAFTAALQQTALYQQLPAVRAGQSHVIGKTLVAGYGDAFYSLDRIEDALRSPGR